MDGVKTWRLLNWVCVAVTAAIGIGLWLIFKSTLPPEVPLFYGLPWGEAQLARPIYLLMPTGISIVGAIAIGLGVGKVKNEKPLVGMMIGTSMIIQLIAVLAVLRIVLLVA